MYVIKLKVLATEFFMVEKRFESLRIKQHLYPVKSIFCLNKQIFYSKQTVYAYCQAEATGSPNHLCAIICHNL